MRRRMELEEQQWRKKTFEGFVGGVARVWHANGRIKVRAKLKWDDDEKRFYVYYFVFLALSPIEIIQNRIKFKCYVKNWSCVLFWNTRKRRLSIEIECDLCRLTFVSSTCRRVLCLFLFRHLFHSGGKLKNNHKMIASNSMSSSFHSRKWRHKFCRECEKMSCSCKMLNSLLDVYFSFFSSQIPKKINSNWIL